MNVLVFYNNLKKIIKKRTFLQMSEWMYESLIRSGPLEMVLGLFKRYAKHISIRLDLDYQNLLIQNENPNYFSAVIAFSSYLMLLVCFSFLFSSFGLIFSFSNF